MLLIALTGSSSPHIWTYVVLSLASRSSLHRPLEIGFEIGVCLGTWFQSMEGRGGIEGFFARRSRIYIVMRFAIHTVLRAACLSCGLEAFFLTPPFVI